jgi:hypothetical protein
MSKVAFAVVGLVIGALAIVDGVLFQGCFTQGIEGTCTAPVAWPEVAAGVLFVVASAYGLVSLIRAERHPHAPSNPTKIAKAGLKGRRESRCFHGLDFGKVRDKHL